MGLTAAGYMWASLAMTAVSVGVQAYGQHQQSKHRQKMMEYNAALAETEAQQKRLEGQERIKRQRARSEKFKKRQKAAYVAAGLTTTGTPLQVMSDTAASLELEALDIAYQTGSQVRSLGQQKDIALMEAQGIRKARPLALGATLAGGAARMAGTYSSYKKPA